MPDYTTNLNLAKPNTTTEPNNTFNLDTYLSDNWNKLDDFAAKTITTDKLVNNLAATEPGFGLDARQGKAIQDEINAVITDNTRTTTSKTVTGAINELNSNKAPLASPSFTGSPTIGGHNAVSALSGGYKIQSGGLGVTISSANSAVTTSVTFPTAFSSAPNVYATVETSSGGNGGYITLMANNATTTGFQLITNYYTTGTVYIKWFAIGS